MRSLLVTTTALGLAAIAAAATPAIDGLGITDANWGGPSLAVQDTNTRFGNNFNELNQLYVTSDDDNVYIGIPGNIADNNALTIFIDTNGGSGSNVLSTEPGGGCPGTVPTLLRLYNGTTLEAGFTPNYALTISVGIFPGQSTSQLVFAADLTNLGTLANVSLGIGAVGSGNGLLTGTSGVEIAIDNSNTAGVGEWFTPGGETPAQTGDNPLSATTGYELAIPRSQLGLSGTTDVCFFAYISNNGQDGGAGVCNGRAAYGSNQGLPGLVGSDNLANFDGALSFLNFNNVAGTQFVCTEIAGAGCPNAGCDTDLNGDCIVDLADLSIVLVNFGGAGGPDEGDFNGDGQVDLADLSFLLTQFGNNCN